MREKWGHPQIKEQVQASRTTGEYEEQKDTKILLLSNTGGHIQTDCFGLANNTHYNEQLKQA